ncbi:MAG: D-alanine--D-alanine ligase, partial [Fibrobacteres bacterium]|nr:D-alanine--D-alanine ligase [Fibrobacterota bacterium]
SNTPRSFEFKECDRALLNKLSELSLAAWEAFSLNGYARVDFRVSENGEPFILEINTNPCISPDAGFNAAAQKAGYTFDMLIDNIIKCALS